MKFGKYLAYFKLAWGLIRLTRDPEQTSAVFDISEALYALGSTRNALQKIAADPASRALLQERRRLQNVDLKQLQTLPEGTLGRVYADHMIRLGLDPNFYRSIEARSETTYVMLRMRQTHDLWHVVTGFDTSVPGEIGLQAFLASQTRVPLSMILMGGALMRSGIDRPEGVESLMDHIVKGWQMGQQAKPLFSLDWEAHWQTPLEQLRRDYQIDSVSFWNLAKAAESDSKSLKSTEI